MRYDTVRNKIFNKYPISDLDGNPISQGYKFIKDGNVIIRRGLTDLSRIEYDLSDISNINFIDNDLINFTFLIKDTSSDGKIWTSKELFYDLKAAKDENNPYYRAQDLLILELDLSKFINYSKEEFLRNGEDRAKVKVTETIDTLNELLEHISYLVDSNENEIKSTNRDIKTPKGYSGLAKFEITDE